MPFYPFFFNTLATALIQTHTAPHWTSLLISFLSPNPFSTLTLTGVFVKHKPGCYPLSWEAFTLGCKLCYDPDPFYISNFLTHWAFFLEVPKFPCWFVPPRPCSDYPVCLKELLSFVYLLTVLFLQILPPSVPTNLGWQFFQDNQSIGKNQFYFPLLSIYLF